MSQSTINHKECSSIRFQGELLPHSMSMIHILINRDFTEQTSDWIWRFAHCNGVWKAGSADWCYSSSSEIIRHLHSFRDEVITEIKERLGLDNIRSSHTYDNWIEGLTSIQRLAQSADEECRWIAGISSQKVENTRKQILSYLDQFNETQSKNAEQVGSGNPLPAE